VSVDLDDAERHALVNLLTADIQTSRFPLSEHTVRLKRIRAKLLGEEPERR
jgi:hypothetical protein